MNPARIIAVLLVLMTAASVAQAQVQEREPPSLTQARVLYDAGKLEEAQRVLETLVRAGTQDPEVFLLAGVVERTEGRLDSAITLLQQGRALAPDAIPIAVELATTLAWNRDLDEATSLFRRVLSDHPDHAGARSGFGFALAWQGRLDEARTTFAGMLEENPRSVEGWLGMGFVERASFRKATAEAAYRRVLELDAGNADARAALEALRWDSRSELRVLGGFSSNPDVPERGEARIQTVYSTSQRLTISGGYQHYAFGAASVIAGGGVLVGTRTEDSLEAGVVFRPSDRATLSTSVYTFFSEELTRGIIWVEGVVAVVPGVVVIGNLRPAFSNTDPRQLWAWALGGSVSFAYQQQLSVRALVATDTEWEPRLTVLANYDAAPSRRIRVSVGAAHSSSDPRFEFTSVTAGATYLLVPWFGLQAEVSRRTGTAERSTLLAGVVLRH